MEIFIALVIVAAIAVGGFGIYRGWFTADKKQFKNDAQRVVDKL